MVEAAELHFLSPALSVWSVYDPAVKAELFSTGIRFEDRLYLVDPIPLARPAWEELTRDARVCGIFVTNVNHERALAAFAAQTGAAILRKLELNSPQVSESLQVIAIEGAAEGEIALHIQDNGGAIILGDALINFGAEGFALLPPKYCADQKRMRRSLRQLLDFSFERLLFAHGTPIVSGARKKLEALLEE